MAGPLNEEQVQKMHAYWRAANYLTVGQIYLKDNPLLERPLSVDDIKPPLAGPLGHDDRTELHLYAFESADQRATT